MATSSNSTSLCGDRISSRRALLASLWSVVSLLTVISFLTAFIFAISAQNNDEEDDYGNGRYNNYYNNNNNNNNNAGASQDEERNDPEVAVTSRALAFSALWTGVMAALLSVFGTVILGWQSPTGQYYTCCSSSVHRTTPLGLGSFIGALLMFANLTLICSVLFGEFEIRDSREGEEKQAADQLYGKRGSRLSMAFSILCVVLTLIYAGFAALTFAYSNCVIDEYIMDEREEQLMLSTRNKTVVHFNTAYDGYIGERFDVGRPTGFVSPSGAEATLT
ncbi:hypothetical protein IV203_000527 [Nitzschia inconspicua]|uniref:Uncharacterized protein n=1 Tax=Nitzschia inconspicua TaxID=303405 RepID=A0A9K3PQS3_9STRA|nr:hypothetical protein IV203_000527 [Nitzschia inconspicua]